MAALCELGRNGVAPFRGQLMRSRCSGCSWLPGPSHIHRGGLPARGHIPGRGRSGLPCLWHQKHLPAAPPLQAQASRRLQTMGCRTPSSRAAYRLAGPSRLRLPIGRGGGQRRNSALQKFA